MLRRRACGRWAQAERDHRGPARAGPVGPGFAREVHPRHVHAGQPDGAPQPAAGPARYRWLGGEVGVGSVLPLQLPARAGCGGTGPFPGRLGDAPRQAHRAIRTRARSAKAATAFVVNIHHHDPRSLFLLSEKRDRLPAHWARSWKPVVRSIVPDAHDGDAVHLGVAPVAALRHGRLRRHAQHGLRVERCRARGPRAQAPRPRLLDGNGRRAAGPSHARLRGPRGCAAPSHGPPRYRRLGSPRRPRSAS